MKRRLEIYLRCTLQPGRGRCFGAGTSRGRFNPDIPENLSHRAGVFGKSELSGSPWYLPRGCPGPKA